MTGGVGQVGGNAMSLRPEMPAVAAISRSVTPEVVGGAQQGPRVSGQGKPGTPREYWTNISRKNLLVFDYRHSL